MKSKIFALVLAAFSAFASVPAMAGIDLAKQPAALIHAMGNFNGVYADSDGAIIRISFEEVMYATVENSAFQIVELLDVDVYGNAITFVMDAGYGPAVTTMRRVSDGIIWELESGERLGLVYVRRLTVPDAVVLACAAYPKAKSVKALANLRQSCP